MKETSPKPIRLEDYKPATHLIPEAHLIFDLHDSRTVVTSRMLFEKEPLFPCLRRTFGSQWQPFRTAPNKTK